MIKKKSKTLAEIADLEVSRIKKILDRYITSEKDKHDEREILLALQYTHYLRWQEAISMLVLEDILKENGIKPTINEFTDRILKKQMEHPFDVKEIEKL